MKIKKVKQDKGYELEITFENKDVWHIDLKNFLMKVTDPGHAYFRNVEFSQSSEFVKTKKNQPVKLKKTLKKNLVNFIDPLEGRPTRTKRISASDLGGLLFGIHDHHPETEQGIYYEADITRLLKLLGHPKPIWGKSLLIDTFLKDKKRVMTNKM